MSKLISVIALSCIFANQSRAELPTMRSYQQCISGFAHALFATGTHEGQSGIYVLHNYHAHFQPLNDLSSRTIFQLPHEITRDWDAEEQGLMFLVYNGKNPNPPVDKTDWQFGIESAKSLSFFRYDDSVKVRAFSEKAMIGVSQEMKRAFDERIKYMRSLIVKTNGNRFKACDFIR